MSRTPRKLSRILIPALVAVLALSGCGTGGNDTEEDDAVRVVRVALGTFSNETLDPAMDGRSASAAHLIQMWDTLLDMAPDGSIAPGVAKEWSVSDDGLVWTFKLRDDVVFHNGDKLTSADVVFSLHRFSDPLAESGGGILLNDVIDTIEAPDDYTVVVTTNRPYLTFPYLVAPQQSEAGIIFPSEYLLENAGEDFTAQSELLNEAPIGSGPFKFVEHVQGDRMVFEAVKDHWRNPPEIDRLEIYLVPEAATQMAMLQSGEIDVITIAGDQITEAESAGAEIRRAERTTGIGLAFSGTFRPAAETKSSNDVRVREAVSLSINREEILETLVNGEGSLPETPFNMSPATQDVVVEDFAKWAARNNRYDPDEARDLLAEAGYPDGVDDIQLFTFARLSTPATQISEIVASQLAEVGIKVNLIQTDYGSYRPHLVNAPDDDAFNAGDMSTYPVQIRYEAAGALETYFMNEGGVVQLMKDAKFDADVKKVSGIVDDEERRKEVSRLGNLASNEFVVLPLFDLSTLYAVNPDVVGEWTTFVGFGSLGRTFETIKAP